MCAAAISLLWEVLVIDFNEIKRIKKKPSAMVFCKPTSTNPQGEFVQRLFLSVIELKFDFGTNPTVASVQRAAICMNASPLG